MGAGLVRREHGRQVRALGGLECREFPHPLHVGGRWALRYPAGSPPERIAATTLAKISFATKGASGVISPAQRVSSPDSSSVARSGTEGLRVPPGITP